MFELPLINSKEVTIIDKEYVTQVSESKWYLHSEGYVCGPAGDPLLHRLVMQASRGTLVDHRNGNKLDNQKSNLRITTYSINAFNRQTVDRRSKSGVPGVGRRGDRWAVYIFKGKRFYLGMADTLVEAARIRAAAELYYYGEVSPAMATALANLEG